MLSRFTLGFEAFASFLNQELNQELRSRICLLFNCYKVSSSNIFILLVTLMISGYLWWFILQFQVEIVQSHTPCALIAWNVVLVIYFNNFKSTSLECSLVDSLLDFVVNKSPKFYGSSSYTWWSSVVIKSQEETIVIWVSIKIPNFMGGKLTLGQIANGSYGCVHIVKCKVCSRVELRKLLILKWDSFQKLCVVEK
jgi:hypothetical protein